VPQRGNPAEPEIGPAGTVAEDVVLQDSTGAPRRLSQLAAAGAVVLVFYRGHW
jgi:peroxiredoxin